MNVLEVESTNNLFDLLHIISNSKLLKVNIPKK